MTSASLKKLIADIYSFNLNGSAPKLGDKPYAGAQPHLRSQPEILSKAECDRRTKVVLKALIEKIEEASADGGVGVQVSRCEFLVIIFLFERTKNEYSP